MSGMLSFVARIGLFIVFIASLTIAGTAMFVIFSSLGVPANLPSSHSPITGNGLTPGTGATPVLTSQIPGAHYVPQSNIVARDGGQLTAGGVLLDSPGGNDWDFFVTKTDSNGNEVWTRNYGESQFNYAWDIQSANDGGYVIVGSTGPNGNGPLDACLFKINEAGEQQWIKTYDDGGNEARYALDKTGDGGYVILAVGSHDHSDRQIAITDRSGQEILDKPDGGNNGSNTSGSGSNGNGSGDKSDDFGSNGNGNGNGSGNKSGDTDNGNNGTGKVKGHDK